MDDAATTLADVADRRLRHDIVAGTLRPGEKLAIAALVKRYGIGASPLREALSRLSSDHLVVVEGQRGFRVAPVTVGELDDVSVCRRLVEMEAVSRSVARGDEAWESRMVAALYRMEKADERVRQNTATDPDEWELRNRQFHEAIISACGSVWLMRLQAQLYAQHERYRRLCLCHRDPDRDVQAEHRAIMEAALARDADGAARLSGAHIDRIAASVRAVLAAGSPAALRPAGRSRPHAEPTAPRRRRAA